MNSENPTRDDADEKLIRDCIECVRAENIGSVSLLQRRLRLGYTNAARIMDELQRRGVVSAPLDNKTTMRTVLPNDQKLSRAERRLP